MATTSEIQVTEAYIGLLGRAPDPAGLAYWTAQLDAAVAAGDTASDALKKLTNDITLSDEWDGGIGANDATTQAGAEAIVTAMYDNLFDRVATASDLAYWSAELVNGTTSASEMAVQLIVAAQANTTNTTDASVLGFKQSAATYYVEQVDQEDFSRETANLAVKDVNGPISLDSSKDATDSLVSGTGLSYALTTGDDSASLVMTLGDDSVTGTVGTDATYQTTDAMNDINTGDSDSLTLSGNAGFAFGSITNVEAVNVNLSKQVGTTFSLTGVQNVTGSSTINVDVAPTVTIAGVEVTGETDVAMTGGLRTDVSTTDVTSLTAALATGTSEAALTITGDVDLATVTLTNIGDSATNIVLADNDSTVNLDGTSATNDVASISAVGEVDLDVDTADMVEKITLSGNGNDVDVTIENAVGSSMTYTTTGDHDVTLTGAASQFNLATIVQSGTGDTGIDVITTAGNLDVWGAGALAGGVTLSVDQLVNSYTYKIASGTDVTIAAAQNAGATHIIDANDTSTSSSLNINVNQNAGTIQTVDYDAVTIDANDSKAITIQAVDTDANDSTLSIVGANDITISATLDTAGTTTISGKKLVITGATDVTEATATTANLSLTATDDIATGALTVQNDITLTAANDITVGGASDAVEGSYTVTGDDFDSTGGALAAQNDISITVTNDIQTAGVSTSDGSITLSGNEIQAGGAISAVNGDVTLTATNDSATSTIDQDISAETLTLADGKFTSATATKEWTADNVVISGDTTVVDSDFVTPSLVITSSGDVTIGSINEGAAAGGFVIAASAATGDISITTDGDATTLGTATIYTGSGDDTVTMADANTTFVVSTGGNTGTETINADDFATGSIINSGDGDDIIDIDSTSAVALTVSAGAGDDTVNLANTAVTGVFDLGDGTQDKVVLQEAAAITPTALGLKNIEELDISATTSTEFDWADLSGNDTTFKLIGAKTLKIDGSTSGETIDLTGITADALQTGNIQVDADAGADTITGAVQMVNVINGDAGADIITGGSAADTLNGGTGNDTITGGEGKDVITGGDGKDTIVITETTAVTDTVTVGSSIGAEADTITGFAVGGTADHLRIDLSEVIDASTNITDLVDPAGTTITAGATVAIKDISGISDISASTETVLYITGTYASTSAVEDALEAGGAREITVDVAAGDTFLIIYDDGTNTYLAAASTDTTTSDDTFDSGELTVEVIAILGGVTDGDAVVADDILFI